MDGNKLTRAIPWARVLLALAALRDKIQARARELLQELNQEFPNNQLYRKELARLQYLHRLMRAKVVSSLKLHENLNDCQRSSRLCLPRKRIELRWI
jgi:hypothetical protein